MDIINLTEEKIKKLPTIGRGGNSVVKILNFHDVAKIYGVYNYESDEEKVDLLGSIKPINNIVLPKKKIYIANEFGGFSMEHIKSSKQMLYTKELLSIQQRIDILVNIKNILLQMFKQNIYMNDLNELNILIKNNIPYIIDIDGISFDQNDFHLVIERYFHLCLYYLYDNLDFGHLIDLSCIEPKLKLQEHLNQVIDDIEKIEKVRELVYKYKKPYLNATF